MKKEKIMTIILILVLVVIFGVPLYALPATLTLPVGTRPGLEDLTIDQAADQLRVSGLEGWELVEAARALVSDRMQYSRRNSFDSASRAFERGYGYCQQMSFALEELLTKLGFDAKVVHAFKNRFPDGREGGHAWVSVTLGTETRYVDPLHYDAQAGEIDFTPISKVIGYTPFFRLFAGWGSTMVNAHRYYVSGKDM